MDSGGLPCTVDPSLPMPIRGLRAEAYSSGKVAIENDFRQSEWQKFSPKGHVQLNNVLFAPLKIDQRTVGVIGLANKEHGFTKRDAEMSMAFGELASIALANSQMLGMLEENEKELKEAKNQLELQIKRMPIGCIVWDKDFRVISWNPAAETIFGYSTKDIIGKHPYGTIVPKESQPVVEEIWRRLLEGDETANSVNDNLTKKGKRITCSWSNTPLKREDNSVIGVLSMVQDITERKKAEEELEKYQNNLERLVEERTKQLKDSERLAAIGATAGMVGHDIRNPLQAIAGDVYLLKDDLKAITKLEEKSSVEESLESIEKNIDYINKIVADLQDFARPLKPNIEKTDLKLIIDELIKKSGLPENIKVTVRIETDARKVVADSSYINRIMYNLVNNAVQAMPKGGKLTIHAYKETNNVLITVKDTGVGIPEAVKGKLFTPMFTTKPKGQGFGLAVIKRMTEALGGNITFESQEDKGTTFTAKLPQRPFTKERA